MSRPLQIVADENMPNLHAHFARWGEITALPGRSIGAAQLRDCDILLVRSVTRVDEALLAGSRVQFVGSATIGTDHVDRDYLAHADIAFAHAPGCNADSVVQYDLAVLAELRPQWRAATVGVLAGGNVGGRVATLLQQLGVDVVVCDPLLEPESVPWPLVALPQLLQCDIILLHAPLTDSGPHPTHHLIGAEQLAALNPGTLLLNAGRGAVIDNRALLDYLASENPCEVVLDVWEQEPLVDAELLAELALGTMHIAGYSLEGRANGSAMVAAALAQHLHSEPAALLETPARTPLTVAGAVDLNAVIGATYGVREDDRRLRQALANCSDAAQRRQQFDQLRRHYPPRHQFSYYTLASADAQLRRDCALLGFAVSDAP